MSVQRDVRLRRAAVGTALVLAAPLSVVSWVLVPVSMVDGTEFVSGIASTSRGTMVASLVTGALFFPLAVIGVMGLMHLLKERPRMVGTLGGGLAIVGLTLNTAAFGAAGTLAEAALSDIAPAQTAALVETTMAGATGVLILFGPLIAAIGTTMLGITLYRARTVPRLPAVMLAIYGPMQVLGFATEFIPIITASYAVMALALIPVGFLFFKASGQEWESPSTFDGWVDARRVEEAVVG